MEILIALFLGVVGVSVIRSLLLGTATTRQLKRHTGYYVSQSYRIKMERSYRSEYTSNRILAGK